MGWFSDDSNNNRSEIVSFCKSKGITFSDQFQFPLISTTPYDLIIIDPNFFCSFVLSPVLELFKSKFVFVLNTKIFCAHFRFFTFSSMMKEFFQITDKIADSEFIFDSKIHKTRYSKIFNNQYAEKMNPFYVLKGLSRTSSKLQILHHITGTKDEVVGFRSEKHYLIPFSTFSKNALEYIFDKFNAFRFNSLTSSAKILEFLNFHFNQKQFYPKHLKQDFERANTLLKEEQTLLSQINKKKKNFVNYINYSFLPIINSKDKILENKILSLFKNTDIEIKEKVLLNRIDLSFQDPENKVHFLCEIKGSENSIESAFKNCFTQLIRWNNDFKKDNPNIKQEQIVLLAIVNSEISKPLNERILTLPDSFKARYSFERQKRHFKIVSTVNLFKILNSVDGKNKLFKQLLGKDNFEIK